MFVTLLDVSKLRTLLKFDGITTNFTDDELEVLIDVKTKEIETLTGVDINPRDRTKTLGRFKGRMIQLSHYPIINIANIFINHHSLNECEYSFNGDLGIIYFNHKVRGSVVIQYTTGLDEFNYDTLINPLLKDMIAYTISFGRNNDKLDGLAPFMSSLKEGDVSIGFNNNSVNGGYGYSIGIANQIDNLRSKFMYSARVRWI